MSPKIRVGAMLKDVMHVKKSTNKSKDLDALIVRYHALQKRIRHLEEHLKLQHSTMIKYHKARAKSALQVALLTAGTPLVEAAGSRTKKASAGAGEKQVLLGESTYGSMHEEAAIKAHDRADEFHKRIIDYVAEWDAVITCRVDAGIKKWNALRRDLDHYENKLASLKHKKKPDDERIDRNAGKLMDARGTYENHLADMCILLEEVTEKSWKDLIPLLARMAAWDKQSADEETLCMSKMNAVIKKLTAVATDHDIEQCSKGDSSRFVKLANEEPSTLLSPQQELVPEADAKETALLAGAEDDDDDASDDATDNSDDDICIEKVASPPPVSDDVNAAEFIKPAKSTKLPLLRKMSGRKCSI